MGPVTYRLKLPQEWKVHNVFHATLLKPYIETETYGENYTRPPPDLLEEQEVYEVETIVKHRRRGKGIQLRKQRGNRKQISPKTETCSHGINFDTNSETIQCSKQ